MKEMDFLKKLEQQSSAQRRLVQTELIPEWAKGLGDWLVVNPWRLVIPVASMVYIVFRIVYGTKFREFILGLFGGF